MLQSNGACPLCPGYDCFYIRITGNKTKKIKFLDCKKVQHLFGAKKKPNEMRWLTLIFMVKFGFLGSVHDNSDKFKMKIASII